MWRGVEEGKVERKEDYSIFRDRDLLDGFLRRKHEERRQFRSTAAC